MSATPHPLLVSYHYARTLDLDRTLERFGGGRPVPVFADSGGYSAFSQGAAVDLDEYAAWLGRWHRRFVAYANLDVIGDAEATARNQVRLRDRGLAPVPVFHVGEPWPYLERYIEDYPYVALGGMVPYLSARRKLLPWLVRCFKLGAERPGGPVRYHGFGATSWHVLRDLPFHSADSSTWTAGSRFGAQLLYGRHGLFQTRAHLLPRHAADLRALGFTVRDAIAATRGDAAKSRDIALASLAAMQADLRRRHGSNLTVYLAGVV